MSFKITATAPTHYQLSTLRYFNMPITNLGNGAHRATITFDTEDEAHQFLIGIAQRYYDEYESQVDPYINEIVTYGFLGIDGVVAHIEEVEADVELVGDNSELDSDAWIDEDDSYLTAQDERDYDAELLARLHDGNFEGTMPIEADIDYWLTKMAEAEVHELHITAEDIQDWLKQD